MTAQLMRRGGVEMPAPSSTSDNKIRIEAFHSYVECSSGPGLHASA